MEKRPESLIRKVDEKGGGEKEEEEEVSEELTEQTLGCCGPIRMHV
jgi:hypothetical protein